MSNSRQLTQPQKLALTTAVLPSYTRTRNQKKSDTQEEYGKHQRKYVSKINASKDTVNDCVILSATHLSLHKSEAFAYTYPVLVVFIGPRSDKKLKAASWPLLTCPNYGRPITLQSSTSINKHAYIHTRTQKYIQNIHTCAKEESRTEKYAIKQMTIAWDFTPQISNQTNTPHSPLQIT